MTPILAIADKAIEGAIVMTAAYLDATNPPLVADPARSWQTFFREGAMRELAALSEENRHRMFVVGYYFMAPNKEAATVLDNLIKADVAAVDAAFRAQWQRRCDYAIPNG